jgi:hypothetical protein
MAEFEDVEMCTECFDRLEWEITLAYLIKIDGDKTNY